MRAPAIRRLIDGHRRFVAGERAGHTSDRQRREGLVDGQQPFAVVVGCSDSRVPPEIVFDQGLGDLFVIRVAGNIITPAVTGSVEFAVEELGTRLVVVLGHTRCGAVQAALEHMRHPSGGLSAGMQFIMQQISSALRDIPDPCSLAPAALERLAVRANIEASAGLLCGGASPVIERHMRESGLAVIGAQYFLETGEVEFLPGARPVSG